MKSSIYSVPGCKKTTAQTVLGADNMNILYVTVEPGGEIPNHSHECAAKMVITKGSALATGTNPRRVSKGDVVIKTENEIHGFSDIEETFEFVSISDQNGILTENGWDISFSA